MTDEGAEGRTPITPVGTLISLALLDSFPLKGGSLFCVGREKVNWPEGPRLRPQARFEANRRKAAALGPR